MRLLALTSFYPPLGYGYGAICADVMEELAARGHDVTVLCADGGPGQGVDVEPGLAHVPAAWRRPLAGVRGEATSQRLVRSVMDRGVDVAFAWHMRGIGKGSLSVLHRAGIPVVYMFGDQWALYEKPGLPGWWRGWNALDRVGPYHWLRQASGSLALPFGIDLRQPPMAQAGHCVFSSRWLRDRCVADGFRPRDARVIPNGLRAGAFRPRDRPEREHPLLAFSGRVDRSKGADLALRALADLPEARLVAAGEAEPYVAALVGELGLADRVELRGRQTRGDQLPELLATADVVVMPGRVEEGFGLVYLEAMAAGTPIVGTAKGGPRDFCVDGENMLVVGEEPHEIAAAVRRILGDAGLRDRLVAGGLRTAAEHDLTVMTDRVEELVVSVSGR
ncbi:MAG: 1,2-diacylglycerol 3-alpha-glucosyltransferase [Solirubrobacteraceae bacterium]|nr:1,2-diacylglycerol 3-alpha-glucosyltransferase [Solirubrobacteraceae bacterium]